MKNLSYFDPSTNILKSHLTYLFAFVALNVLCWGDCARCEAETETGRFLLAGLSVDEVAHLFGPPSHKNEKRKGRETWIYGKSTVMFTDGKVTAWSNFGDLDEHKNLAAVQREDEDIQEYYDREWLNLWTPHPGLEELDVVEEVVDSLIKRKQQGSSSQPSSNSFVNRP